MSYTEELTELAQEVAYLIGCWNRLCSEPIHPAQHQEMRAILEELIMIESLFPEVARVNSPAQRLNNLVNATYGDGALCGKYTLISFSVFDTSYYRLPGDGPFVAFLGTPALLDIFYIDRKLVKITLRDAERTDVTEYATALELYSTIDLDTSAVSPDADIRVTISLRLLNTEPAHELSLEGRTKEVLQKIFPVHPETGKPYNPDVRYSRDIVDATVRRMDGEVDGLFSYISIGNEYPVDGKVFETFDAVRKELPTIMDEECCNVAFIYNAAGDGVVYIDRYRFLTRLQITNVTPRFSSVGILSYRMHAELCDSKRTIINPRHDDITFLSSECDTIRPYPGDIIVCKGVFYSPSSIVGIEETPNVTRDMTSRCPICAHHLSAYATMKLCTNNICKGVVNQRVRSLCDPSSGWALPIFGNPDHAEKLIDTAVSHGYMGHFVSVLMALQDKAVLDDLDATMGAACIVGPLHDRIRRVMHPKSLDDWKLARNLIEALGMLTIIPDDIDRIFAYANTRQWSPIAFTATVLPQVLLLRQLGTHDQHAVILACEAKHRQEEFDLLLELFDSESEDTNRCNEIG